MKNREGYRGGWKGRGEGLERGWFLEEEGGFFDLSGSNNKEFVNLRSSGRKNEEAPHVPPSRL